jgi:hypothetical protein
MSESVLMNEQQKANAVERARAWALANPERRREIALRSYLKHRPALKPVLTPQERFEQHVSRVPESGCWIWTASLNRNGYGKAKVDGKDITAHRWSWMLHNGAIPDGLHVCHTCDVRACVNPAHLWLGTHKDNNDDKIRKGRQSDHVPPPKRTLTEDQVREIRASRGKMGVVALAKLFGVDHTNISRIQNRKTYAHVG